MATKDKKGEEKIYTVSLRGVFNQPKTKRAAKAIKMIKNFLIRHVGEGIKMDNSLSEFIWNRRRETPPREIKVKIIKDGDNLRATLSK